MRGKSIAQALEGLGSDPEMVQHLVALADAIDAVVWAPDVVCEHCGQTELDLDPEDIPVLADRLFTVSVELQSRMQQASRKRSREMRAEAEDERARSRCNPGLEPRSKRSKSRDGLDGGAR